jgi:predicted nucleic acid-binding protein
MFILDTNIISETFRSRPDPNVAAWMGSLVATEVYVTSLSKAELLVGLAFMPDGRRRAALGTVIEAFFSKWLQTPVLAFGSMEAEAYAETVAGRRRLGRPISAFDAQIAAIARIRDFAVVTRNVRDFEHCGIEIINPWNPASP